MLLAILCDSDEYLSFTAVRIWGFSTPAHVFYNLNYNWFHVADDIVGVTASANHLIDIQKKFHGKTIFCDSWFMWACFT